MYEVVPIESVTGPTPGNSPQFLVIKKVWEEFGITRETKNCRVKESEYPTTIDWAPAQVLKRTL